MNTTPDESALQELTNRLAKLEQANADLQEKLATIQAERAIAGEQPIPHRPGPPPPGPPAAFSSALAGIPAVDAIGTLGADGMDASSDSGTGVCGCRGTDGTGVPSTQSSRLPRLAGCWWGRYLQQPPPSFPMASMPRAGLALAFTPRAKAPRLWALVGA